MAKIKNNAIKYHRSDPAHENEYGVDSECMCPAPTDDMIAAGTDAPISGLAMAWADHGTGSQPSVHDSSQTAYWWATGDGEALRSFVQTSWGINKGAHAGTVAHVIETDVQWDYQVQVQIGDVNGAGTDADVYVSLTGENGTVNNYLLDQAHTNDFEQGGTYTYPLRLINSVGKLSGLSIHHEGGAASSEMFLEWIKVTDHTLNEEFDFYYHGWIDDDQTVTLTPAGAITDYQIATHTGTENKSGTNANVHITLHGTAGDSGSLLLDSDDNNFESGQTDTFNVSIPGVGNLNTVTISSDNSGSAAGWYLDWIKVTQQSTGAWWQFDCYRWLDSDEGNSLSYTLSVTDSSASSEPT
ncbi:hypothetical protein J4573_31430 [Actinomadura barringtoniae]|uniref:PLAT domain-containing protein n=1 Tax=Actinomadura barringtoniae TaxID=1427535 RepID=A0A939PM19_9ACTN|nr:PLAT/LH2 domain-containing protein [Actinomadura barringtoniae]MBO2451639.1 hypothetical protein [Actinomadura barringtoniae]